MQNEEFYAEDYGIDGPSELIAFFPVEVFTSNKVIH